jgi:hypothetical protein
MRVIYVAHPLGPDGPERDRNRANAARWCGWLAREFDVAPVADWIILSGAWSESPDNRERGLAIDFALIARCDEVWLVGGRISPGVYDLTMLGFEAPSAAKPQDEVMAHRCIAEIVGFV